MVDGLGGAGVKALLSQAAGRRLSPQIFQRRWQGVLQTNGKDSGMDFCKGFGLDPGSRSSDSLAGTQGFGAGGSGRGSLARTLASTLAVTLAGAVAGTLAEAVAGTLAGALASLWQELLQGFSEELWQGLW